MGNGAMAKEEGEEETYSLIFSSLKHPIRRKILRILQNREQTFSEILKILDIDGGHLSYHLESLGELVTHNQNGKYMLSSFGAAAVRLMGGVEEFHAPTVSKPKSTALTYAKIFSLVLAFTLLMVSLYSMNLVTSTKAMEAGWSNIPLALPQNRTFDYPLNFTQTKSPVVSEASPTGFVLNDPEFVSKINEWVEYYPQLDIEINQTYSLEFTHTYLNITVFDSKGNAASSTIWGADSKMGSSSGWVGAVITRPDSYRLEVRNTGPDWLYANLGVHVLGQYFQRPLFYYGLAGLIMAPSYIVGVLISWCWTKRRNTLRHA